MSWKALVATASAASAAFVLGASPAIASRAHTASWAHIASPAHTAARAHTASRAHRATPVPFGFVGMNVDLPVWPNSGIDLGQQLDNMVASGVDTVRAVVDWSGAQPYSSWSEVPAGAQDQFVDAGGVPTDFSDIDALVAQTAERGIRLLPIVINAPSWDATTFPGGQVAIPRSPGPYAAFVKALVLRYGRNGTFWQQNPQIPRAPIEMWQIWNEPDVYSFWPENGRGFARGYVRLLRAAHAAIKGADASAKVVLAGLANYSWEDLRHIIRRGGRHLFDVVDIHPYTRTPQGVITILSFARQVLNKAGLSRVPIVAGEISWPTSEGHSAIRVGFDIGTTEAGQANRLRKLLPMLAHDRRSLGLAGFDYYNWASLDQDGSEVFDFAGLFHLDMSDYQFTAKPAAATFRSAALALEGCSSKGALATECNH